MTITDTDIATDAVALIDVVDALTRDLDSSRISLPWDVVTLLDQAEDDLLEYGPPTDKDLADARRRVALELARLVVLIARDDSDAASVCADDTTVLCDPLLDAEAIDDDLVAEALAVLIADTAFPLLNEERHRDETPGVVGSAARWLVRQIDVQRQSARLRAVRELVKEMDEADRFTDEDTLMARWGWSTADRGETAASAAAAPWCAR